MDSTSTFHAANEWLTRLLEDQGIAGEPAAVVARVAMILALTLVALAADFVARKLITILVRSAVERTTTTWDDVLLEEGVFNRLSQLAPVVLVHIFAPVVLSGWPIAIAIVREAAIIYMIVVGVLVVNALLDAGVTIFRTLDVSRRVHVRSFAQVLRLLAFIAGGILILSHLIGRSPIVFLSGLGAATAVLILVFKDTILGLVAGIQLSANDMVRRGDWIEMPKFGADGDVMDVTLTTVKVQNWDKTITTIPTYALISDAFTNWRGMAESGGRRIKRSLYIDMSSIRIADDDMLDRFAKFAYISEYVEKKKAEVTRWNEEHGLAQDEPLINGRRLTNVGTFRAYAAAYLRQHPMLNQEMTLIVRHLQPSDKGLPIEIYVFSRDQKWENYEAIQADIFDHLLAVVPEFGLRVFQLPTGHDVARLGARLREETA